PLEPATTPSVSRRTSVLCARAASSKVSACGAGVRAFLTPASKGGSCRPRAAREDHRSVDGVLKLADVTGPRVAHEPLHHVRRNTVDAPAEPSGVVRDEVAYEKRDVLGPLAKGLGMLRRHG